MIYVLAGDLDDALQWCGFNGVRIPREACYVGRPSGVDGHTMTPEDRIVRTARYHEHPLWPEIDMAVAEALDVARMTETLHGRLVLVRS